MSKFKKVRTFTELQEIRQLFPNYDKTKLKGKYDAQGNIISIETTNKALKAILKAKGFVEV